jgi:hypothetical protein
MTPRRYGPLAYVPIHRRLPLTWPDGARVALWVNPNVESSASTTSCRATSMIASHANRQDPRRAQLGGDPACIGPVGPFIGLSCEGRRARSYHESARRDSSGKLDPLCSWHRLFSIIWLSRGLIERLSHRQGQLMALKR